MVALLLPPPLIPAVSALIILCSVAVLFCDAFLFHVSRTFFFLSGSDGGGRPAARVDCHRS